MIHLTHSDYRVMPWANGRGVTTELWRQDRDGALLCRLSMAAVTEDGPFSLFSGIERNLTVISGPGFGLEGAGICLAATPLVPVAFAGDVAVRATGVTAPSDDFNVMTARTLPRPEVTVCQARQEVAEGGLIAVFALAPAQVNGKSLATHDLLLTRQQVSLNGMAVVVRLHGL